MAGCGFSISGYIPEAENDREPVRGTKKQHILLHLTVFLMPFDYEEEP
jgi:hypothetical protein